MLDVCMVIYLDDILIYFNDSTSPKLHVKEVFQQLQLHNLFTQEDKCEFHQTIVEFLGYILSLEDLTMGEEKVKGIQDWPEPWKVQDIQAFLSFTNFYQCFIHNYSRITIPLTRLTHKGMPWDFSQDCRQAFKSLKKAFTMAPILMHWLPDCPLLVETDASNYALTAILSLQTSDGKIHPIAFHS